MSNTCDPVKAFEKDSSYSRILQLSPVKQEEHLKVFLERKYSEKKTERTPVKAKLISICTQTDENESDTKNTLMEAQMQLQHIREICQEKDKHYGSQIHQLK